MQKAGHNQVVLSQTLQGALVGIISALLAMWFQKTYHLGSPIGTYLILLGIVSLLLVFPWALRLAVRGALSRIIHTSSSQEDSQSTPMMKSERYSEMVELWLCGKNRKS